MAHSEGFFAAPWQVIEIVSINDGVVRVCKVLKDGQFEKVVVGQPEGKIGLVVKKFIQGLKNCGFEVIGVDEHLSTRNATELMVEIGMGKKKRQISDAFSAALILQQFLDSR